MPVEVSTSQASQWRLDRRFGTGYAVISTELADGSWVSGPVVIGACLPYAGYRKDIEHYLDQVLREGEYITIVNSGVAIGYNGELAVVEISNGDGGTLSETFVSQGWAIPAEELLAFHSRREQLVRAAHHARQHGLGMWHDDAWLDIHEEVLSAHMLERIGAAPELETRSFTTVSVVVAVIVLVLVGMRLWYYSNFVADQARLAGRGWGRRLLDTGMEAFGLRSVYHRADYMPLPGPGELKQVVAAKPEGAADGEDRA